MHPRSMLAFKETHPPGVSRPPRAVEHRLANGSPATSVLVRVIGGIPEVAPVRLAATGGVALAAVMAVLIGPAAAAETSIDSSFAASETYTDNVDLDPSGEESDALFSDLTTSTQIRSTGRRLSGALDATTVLRYQTAKDDEGFSVLPNIIGFGNAELIEELFFLDATATATRQLLDTSDSNSESNQNTVLSYNVSPYLVNRFGSFAESELRANFGQVTVIGGDASDQTTYGGRYGLNSGSDFNRFLWSLNTSASNSKRSGDGDVSRAQADGSVEYRAFRFLSLLGSAGYQIFDDGDSGNDVNDPTWEIGLRVTPSPRAELSATYGQQDNQKSFGGNLRYEITPRLQFTSSYQETLETSQEQFIFEPSDVDQESETIERPGSRVTDIDDQTARVRVFQASLAGERGRNTFGLNGVFEDRNTKSSNDNDDDSRIISVGANWNRQLRRDLNAAISLTYQNADFKDEGRKDDTYGVSGTLSYSIWSNISAFTSYSHNRRDSTDSDNEYVENRITIGLQYTF